MILEWQLANFKAVGGNTVPLEFRNLTVFAGANSSGKSTVLQSILLFMQTMVNREDVALQFNGELVSLGQVEDVWHKGRFINPDGEPIPLVFGMTVRDGLDPNSTLKCQLAFAPVPEQKTQVRVSEGLYTLQSADNYDSFSFTYGERRRYYISEISESLEAKIIDENQQLGLVGIEPLIGARLGIIDFYPRTLKIRGQRTTRELNWPLRLANPSDKRLTEDQLKQEIPPEYWEKLLQIIQQLNLSLSNLKSGNLLTKRNTPKKLVEYQTWFNKLNNTQAEALKDKLRQELDGITEDFGETRPSKFFERIENLLVDLFTQRIRYLSANRLSPTMLYSPSTSANWSEVGVTGDNTGSAIQEHLNKPIRCWDPHNGQILENISFGAALIGWMQYFGLLERVEVEDRGKLGMLLKVFTPGLEKELDLTSVGFGTSQILPIIVQGLLTPPGGVFIVEQPEVHLHPAAQAKLADFFLGLVRAGVQCIIETHSEHIINRLRRRIAEDQETHTERLIRIYFAERDRELGETRFTPVEVNQYGVIGEWPEGFFEQAEDDSVWLAKAAREKKKRDKETKNAASG